MYVEELAGELGIEESVNEKKGKADRGKDMRQASGQDKVNFHEIGSASKRSRY